MTTHIAVLKPAELYTILAALRLWQGSGYCTGRDCLGELYAIATNDYDSSPLSEEAVGELCQKLNCETIGIDDDDFTAAMLAGILAGKHIVEQRPVRPEPPKLGVTATS